MLEKSRFKSLYKTGAFLCTSYFLHLLKKKWLLPSQPVVFSWSCFSKLDKTALSIYPLCLEDSSSISLSIFLQFIFIPQDNGEEVGFNLLLVAFTFIPSLIYFGLFAQFSSLSCWRPRRYNCQLTGEKTLLGSKCGGEVKVQKGKWLKKKERLPKSMFLFLAGWGEKKAQQDQHILFEKCQTVVHLQTVKSYFVCTMFLVTGWMYSTFLSWSKRVLRGKMSSRFI